MTTILLIEDAKDLAQVIQRQLGDTGYRGLALVKELTEAMGGRVAVESTLGKGSIFAVWLPRSKT